MPPSRPLCILEVVMDDLIEAVIELFGDLFEQALKGIKDPNKRKWALTSFYSFVTLAITAFLIWGAVATYLDGNLTGSLVFAAVAAVLSLFFGLSIVHGHKKNWKGKKDN